MKTIRCWKCNHWWDEKIEYLNATVYCQCPNCEYQFTVAWVTGKGSLLACEGWTEHLQLLDSSSEFQKMLDANH